MSGGAVSHSNTHLCPSHNTPSSFPTELSQIVVDMPGVIYLNRLFLHTLWRCRPFSIVLSGPPSASRSLLLNLCMHKINTSRWRWLPSPFSLKAPFGKRGWLILTTATQLVLVFSPCALQACAKSHKLVERLQGLCGQLELDVEGKRLDLAALQAGTTA